MSTFRKAVLLGLLLVPAAATPARAAGLVGFFDFLDHLSGPGPFQGIGFDFMLICDDDNRRISGGCLFKSGGATTSGSTLATRRFEAGPHVSWLRGSVNEAMIYPAGTPDDAKRVNALTYGGHAYLWWRPRAGGDAPWLGATVRFTAVRFSGDLVRDGSITSTMVGVGPIVGFPLGTKGYRVDINPLVLLGLGPFKASDFGASGPLLGSDGVKWTVHIGLHL